MKASPGFEFPIYDQVQAQHLLGDPSHNEGLYVTSTLADNANAIIYGLELAILDRYAVGLAANGSYLTTFAPDSTWDLINTKYEAACITPPKELIIRFTPDDESDTPHVTAQYFVPLAAIGRARQAVTAAFDYKPVEQRGGKSTSVVRKLGRHSTLPGKLRDNPFYKPKPTPGSELRFSPGNILGNALNNGRAGT